MQKKYVFNFKIKSKIIQLECTNFNGSQFVVIKFDDLLFEIFKK